MTHVAFEVGEQDLASVTLPKVIVEPTLEDELEEGVEGEVETEEDEEKPDAE